MSKRSIALQITTLARGELMSSPLENLVKRLAPAAPSAAAKPRLVARFAALAVLVEVRCSLAAASVQLRSGGAYRDRTDDLMLAKQPLSQLS